MNQSTITSKGQTTVPREIREALHLKPGDRITYEVVGDSVVIRPRPSLRSLMGSLPPPPGMENRTLEEENEAAIQGWLEGNE